MTVTFCSFNVRVDALVDAKNRWKRRRDLVCDIWRDAGWDVVGVQEPLRNQLDDIQARLPGYGVVGVGREDGRSKGEHCAIFYRSERFLVEDQGTFWLSDTPDVVASSNWGNACVRICTWARLLDGASSQAFTVYNVHADHVSQRSRKRSSDLLVDRINGRSPVLPVVLMGDFNAEPENRAIRRFTAPDSPVTDTFSTDPTARNEAYTYHAFTGRRFSGKIDYIFATHDWTVLATEIVHTNRAGRYPSDHFPLTAVLSIPHAAVG